ncbi:MAG: RNA polymerase sigma-70 factor [Gemmatimonadaceae bacterium]
MHLDAAAFEALFREHHTPLCAFVYGYVRSRAVAEEIVQDLFFALWGERERLAPRTTLRAYLYAGARNRALHALRHERVAERWRGDAERGATPTGSAGPAKAADEQMVRDESERALGAAIAALPERTRLAATLRWTRGLSYAECAEAMEISVKGVEGLLASAMRKLRARG